MRNLIFIAILTSIFSCNSSTDNYINSSNNNIASIKKEIVGKWELYKKKNRPYYKFSLVEASMSEYLEIKPDGTCQDGRISTNWFLSYTEDFVVDSTSKVIFSKLYNLKDNIYYGYERTIEPYQIKVNTENGIKYLYLTSLQTSATRIYIRKN